MALTVRQRITLFNVLGIPYISEVNRIMDRDNLLVLKVQVSGYSANLAATAIDSRLAEVALVPDLEADLVYCLDRWFDLFGDSTEMVAGGTSGASGVSFNLQQERMQLRERILTVVPFSREYFADELGRTQRDRLQLDAIR